MHLKVNRRIQELWSELAERGGNNAQDGPRLGKQEDFAPTHPEDLTGDIATGRAKPAHQVRHVVRRHRERALLVKLLRVVTAPLGELTPELLDAAINLEMRDELVELTTDLEAFNAEPIV